MTTATDISDASRVRAHYERVCAAALDEDLGGGGPSEDVTTVATIPEDLRGQAVVIAKGDGAVCGLPAIEVTFGHLDQGVGVHLTAQDGDEVESGTVLAHVRGPIRPILTGERTALNVLGHLSGVATLTRAFVGLATGVEICDTRKTLPGLRALEKHAVRVGGGTNHRFALWDGVLVKDTHIVACGGVGEATRRATKATTLPVQVECSSGDEALEAIDAGADALLLDNVPADELAGVVSRVRTEKPDVLIEASGGITLDTVEAFATTGVDRISVGALTHSAPSLDVSLRLVEVGP